jgi:hypothetical protein
MEKETNLVTLSIVFGLILTISLSIVNSTFSSAYAKSDQLQFEISDCAVQRNSTYEKSGPCTGTSIETKVDKNVETKPIDSFEPQGSELIDPFGPTVK